MPTARPTQTGTAVVELLASHQLRIRTDNDREEASGSWLPMIQQSQVEVLVEQLPGMFERALRSASAVVEHELYRNIRAGVAALLAESPDPAAAEALAMMITTHGTAVDGEMQWTTGLEADVDPGMDDMGSTLAQLLAIGLANRAGIGVRWLVQRAREEDCWSDPRRAPARWADIGAVLGITPQAAAKRFGDDQSRSPCSAIESTVEPLLPFAVQKRI